MLRWIVVGGLLAASACSLAFPLDGYSEAGSNDDGGGATPGHDGSAETGIDRDTGPARFCETFTGTFCADFDEGVVLDGWSYETADAPGTHELSMSPSLSRALHSTMPRRSNAKARISLTKSFPGNFRRFVLDCDVHLVTPDWMSGDINAALLEIDFESDSKNEAFYLTSGRDYTDIGLIGLAALTGEPLPTSAPFHVQITLDPAGQWDAKVGEQVFHKTFAPIVAGANPEISFELGVIGFNAPAPTFDVYYDNVTIDLR